ncbi:uncharacterized protein LOC129739069 [Uranotaenia lowii]|uniref:uncharacterized protein LOC129739069 n=1 Tax=Uranotaenia lowii TaxID=190385 RepID=UPI00247ACF91|nr:uncharacterized protein LOC129739069 [Uranotaenia lowii]
MKFKFLLLLLALGAECRESSSKFKPIVSHHGSSGVSSSTPSSNNRAFTKSPVLIAKWPSKKGLAKPFMMKMRPSGTRLAPVVVRPPAAMMMSLKRPIKSVFTPSYAFLKQPGLLNRPLLGAASQPLPFVMNLNLKHKFQPSPQGPKSGEIVYEKLKPLLQQSPSGHRLAPAKEGAIHTIPAPNLAAILAGNGNVALTAVGPSTAALKYKPTHQLKISTFEDSNQVEIDIQKTTKPGFVAVNPNNNFVPSNHQGGGLPAGFGAGSGSAGAALLAGFSTPLPIHQFRHPAAYAAGAHQYQVTEQYNDITLKDPLSGKKTYFAPDPDPRLPSKALVPTTDPLSEPSIGKYPPTDLLIQAQTQSQNHYLPQPNSASILQKPYYDIVKSQAPQANYAVPLASQPQLQQHILQQTSMLQGMPLSLYNPTYLVTQSNNLFNNHQQQLQSNLFKPENNFFGSLQNSQPIVGNTGYESYMFKNSEPAASPGQILAATQDQLHELQNAVTQIQLNDLQQQPTLDTPTYAQLVGHEHLAVHQQQLPQQNQLEEQLQQQLIQQQEKSTQQQHQLSSSEISSLLNYGTINLHNQLSPNDYYHYQTDQDRQQVQQQQSFYELSERQKENERILAQAQQDLQQQQQQLQYQQSYLEQPDSVRHTSHSAQTAQSDDYYKAYQEHQKAVANALGLNEIIQNSKRAASPAPTVPESSTTEASPLRIFVPDSESEYPNSVKAQKRMDELSFEYADDEEAANLYNTEPISRAYYPTHDDESNDDDELANVGQEEEATVDEPPFVMYDEQQQQEQDTVDNSAEKNQERHIYSNHRLD